MILVHIEPYQATLDTIEEHLTEMGKKQNMHNILKKAVNEVANVGKERIHKETRAYYTIKSRAFRKSDIVKRATSSRHPGATLTIRGEPIGVKEGYATRKNGKRKGAGVQIIKQSTVKELEITSGGHVYKAFLTNTQFGHEGISHYGIFQRIPGKYMKNHPAVEGESKGREGIKEIYSLSKAKAAAMVFHKSGMSTELQAELAFQMLKHMNAAIGGTK